MPVTSLDTHAVVKDLVAAGFTDEQAEAVTRVVRQAQDLDLSYLATKADLASTKADLTATIATTKADLAASIATTKADLEKQLAETKAEILKWMVGTIGIQTVVIIGAVLALARLVPR